MNLTIVKRFDNAIDAHLFRIKLENEGIECFIADEEIVTLNPLYSNAVGGIKVKVRDEDVEYVKRLLDEEAVANPVFCPKCGSDQVELFERTLTGWKGFISLLVTLFSGAYPLYTRTYYQCNTCGNEFEHVPLAEKE